jgi:hypothetical protein
MAEATQNEVEYADYYECTAGLTIGVNVCQEGDVVEGSAMGFSETNPPLTEEEQLEKYGQVMYKEYTPDDDEDLVPIQQRGVVARVLMGMQSPGMPPVDPIQISEAPLEVLSRQELRKKAKGLGLNFPEDTDRDQMIGAINKKLAEPGEDRDEPEVVAKRRASAKEEIEKNNELATGQAGGGGSPPARRSRAQHQNVPEEHEETT